MLLLEMQACRGPRVHAEPPSRLLYRLSRRPNGAPPWRARVRGALCCRRRAAVDRRVRGAVVAGASERGTDPRGGCRSVVRRRYAGSLDSSTETAVRAGATADRGVASHDGRHERGRQTVLARVLLPSPVVTREQADRVAGHHLRALSPRECRGRRDGMSALRKGAVFAKAAPRNTPQGRSEQSVVRVDARPRIVAGWFGGTPLLGPHRLRRPWETTWNPDLDLPPIANRQLRRLRVERLTGDRTHAARLLLGHADFSSARSRVSLLTQASVPGTPAYASHVACRYEATLG